MASRKLCFVLTLLFSVYCGYCDTIYEEEDVLHPVFICGVMKRGEPMHHWLQNPEHGVCQFLTEARTVEKLPMVIATKYNVPVVIYRPDMGCNIQGELYNMNLNMIKTIDKYEYLPNEIIARIEMVTYNDTNTTKTVTRPAIMYVKYYVEDDEWLMYPFLSDYHSKGDHGLEFRERPVKKKKKKDKKKKKNICAGENKSISKTNDTDTSEGDVVRKTRRMERSYNKTKRKEASLLKSKFKRTGNITVTKINITEVS